MLLERNCVGHPIRTQSVGSCSASSGYLCRLSGVACRRIEFETPLFKGCAVIWAQGLPTTPEGLFEGQRRKTSITIQGRFKRELDFEDVVTGQEFGRPAQNLPAKWLVETVLIKVCCCISLLLRQMVPVRTCLIIQYSSTCPDDTDAMTKPLATELAYSLIYVQLAKRISPSMEIGPLSAPYLLVPVMALAQVVNVSRPGEEPDPAGHVPEDVRLHDSAFTDAEGALDLIWLL